MVGDRREISEAEPRMLRELLDWLRLCFWFKGSFGSGTDGLFRRHSDSQNKTTALLKRWSINFIIDYAESKPPPFLKRAIQQIST
jgi:hypothetical protein